MTATALETTRAFVYVETAVGGSNHRNSLKRFDEFTYPASAVDVFATWARFDGGLLDHFKTTRNKSGNNSVAGYRGVCWAPRAPIDVDRGDLSEALEDTRRLVSWLVSTWEIPAESLVIAFSGSKGFHVELPAALFGGFSASADLPARVGRLIAALLEDSGITVDSSVYGHLWLWRKPNTKHSKTGFYAIPLTADELRTLSIDDIRARAKAPRITERLADDEWQARPELAALWRATSTQSGAVVQPMPTAEPLGEIHPNGARNSTLQSLAGTLRRRNASPDAIRAALHAENGARCQPPLDDAEVDAIAAGIERYPPAPGQGQASTATTRAELTNMADVTPTRVSWLWPGRIPLGKLTIWDGDPGLGKSLLTLDLTARVTKNAAMPDGTLADLGGPRDVILLALEDDPSDTIRPRLDAAGADVARVHHFRAISTLATLADGTTRKTSRLPTLADIDELRDAIIRTNAALLIVDPIMAYFRGDSHIDNEVRQVLAQLADLAQSTGCAIAAVRHLNKSGGGNAIYRGGGSIAFIAAARSGMLVAKDPDDDARRILVSTKNNLAEPPAALAYAITENEEGTARVDWRGPTTHTANELLATLADPEERANRAEASDWLTTQLATGALPVRDLEGAARAHGISWRTVERAKKDLGIIAAHHGFGRTAYWDWHFPDDRDNPKQATDEPKTANNAKDRQTPPLDKLAVLADSGGLRLDGRPLTGADDRERFSL